MDYDSHDALGLAALVAAGEVSPDELLDEALERVQRVNPALNAVVLVPMARKTALSGGTSAAQARPMAALAPPLRLRLSS